MPGPRPSRVVEIPKRPEQLAVIRRVMDSVTFQRSDRLRDFLQYICDCSLEDRLDDAHEQTIGHVVFGRPVDYNPADDNIVRVSARQLRAKLREYFDTEGRGESWLLEVPKGSYLPIFQKRIPENAPPEATTRSSYSRRKMLIPAAIIALTGILVAYGLPSIRSRNAVKGLSPSVRVRVSAPPNFVAALFRGSKEPIQIVPSDSRLVLMQALSGHLFTLKEYADHSYLQLPKNLPGNPAMQGFWNFLCSRQILNIGDIEAIYRLRVSLLRNHSEPIVELSPNLTARDFTNGNFILLGSSYSNPWAQLFAGRLNFRFAHAEVGGPSEILNLHPHAGEQKVYASQGAQWKDGISYAHVALVQNLTNSGRVLLIEGISMQATEAASDFLLSRTSIKVIPKLLGGSGLGQFPNFELLLKTSSIEDTPDSARVIAVRADRPSS